MERDGDMCKETVTFENSLYIYMPHVYRTLSGEYLFVWSLAMSHLFIYIPLFIYIHASG